mmetsp:Transcript_94306/g.244077  ORF Transcript_94306/g.244077 Transcript_94306/m.244077 type:complete len:233 (-) Transcript_94306:1264-1962(-)
MAAVGILARTLPGFAMSSSPRARPRQQSCPMSHQRARTANPWCEPGPCFLCRPALSRSQCAAGLVKDPRISAKPALPTRPKRQNCPAQHQRARTASPPCGLQPPYLCQAVSESQADAVLPETHPSSARLALRAQMQRLSCPTLCQRARISNPLLRHGRHRELCSWLPAFPLRPCPSLSRQEHLRQQSRVRRLVRLLPSLRQPRCTRLSCHPCLPSPWLTPHPWAPSLVPRLA